MNFIQIKDLGFSYRNLTVFNDFSLNISARITGVIGKNGAGKSTLLKLLLGLIRVKSGKINIFNFDIAKHRLDVLNKIGVLFENPLFPPWYHVQNHLIWLAQVRGATKSEAYKSTNELIKQLNLEDKADVFVSELSAGLRQRFGIAQALIGTPKLILLDEPMSNLDVQSRRDVLILLKDYVERFDSRIVMFSHILSDLEKFCDDYIIIDSGVLIKQDSISNMFKLNFNKHYSLKFANLDDSDMIKVSLQKFSVEIIRESNYELEFIIRDEEIIPELRKIANNFGAFLYPTLGLLEETFLELTSKWN